MRSDALAAIRERERGTYLAARPRAVALAAAAARHFAGGVPMHWMRDWPLPAPLYVQEARDALLVDVDGNTCADFCLGDTGALFGHSPPAIADAVAAQAGRGLTTMLPSAILAEVGDRLAALFGLPWWQLTQSATDANRAVLRLARMITGKARVLVFDGCYHGAVEDTLVVMGPAGETLPRPGQIGRVSDPASTTRVVPFNDIDAVAGALAHQDLACVLMEPVMTNAGMVLPRPGFLEAVRALCTRHDVPLVIDETHTLSSGLGGYARQHQLAADFLVCGKAIAGGVPCAVYGYSDAMAGRIAAADAMRESGHSGIGTTLSANPLAVAALHAALTHLHTAEHYSRMEQGASHLATALAAVFAALDLRWQIARVGARLECQHGRQLPDTARESLAAIDHGLHAVLHLALVNRGVLVTPFHNMLLVSPATTSLQLNACIVAMGTVCAELAPWMGSMGGADRP